jgi:hypothetical protein
MISKQRLKGKYVAYYDRDDKLRIGRVIRIVGNYLTMVDAAGRRRRVYRDRIVGRQLPKRGMEEIEW